LTSAKLENEHKQQMKQLTQGMINTRHETELVQGKKTAARGLLAQRLVAAPLPLGKRQVLRRLMRVWKRWDGRDGRGRGKGDDDTF
jgi:hypothetical protein